MIQVILLKNIFKPQDRIIETFEDQITVAELKEKLQITQGEYHVRMNGQDLEDSFLLVGECNLAIFPVIGKGGGSKNIVGLVAGIALMAFTGGTGAGLLGVISNTTGALGLGLTMYFGGSLLTGNQKIPTIDTPNVSNSSFEGGYGWNTDNIRIQAGAPISLTFGSIRTSGQLLGRRLITRTIDEEQVQFLYLLLGANDGELDSISDLTVNDNAIASIENATYETRLGTNQQTAVTGYISEVAEQQTFSNELPLDVSNWVTKTQTTVGVEVELQFVCPQGVYAVDTSSGAQNAILFTLKIQYREVGASTWIDYYTGGYEEVSTVNLRSPFYWKETFTPPDPTKNYEFRAQNYTYKNYLDNYWGGADYGENPANVSWNCNWISLTVLTDDAQTYPNTAIIALGLPASENLSGSLPKVSWLQTRSTVLVWNGSAYVEKDATNLAWIIYGLIHDCRQLYNIQTSSNEYVVFGEPKENLDYTSFNNFATFCATETDGVPVAMGNLLVDAPGKMWPTIQKIASSARAFIIQTAGVFKPVWDQATTMTQIFTSGNIEDGSLKGSFLPARERASAIEASFINEDNNYAKDTMLVTIADYDPSGLDNPTQIFFPGLTNSDVVFRAAKFMLRKNKYLKRVAKWSADIDSIVSQIGDVVGVQSDICSWGVGGRIRGATTTQIVVDQDISLTAGVTYSILVRFNDDTLIRQTLDTVLVDVTTDTLNFTSDPFSVAPGQYDLFAFGVSELETKPFTITRISRNGDLQADLEGIEYISDIYTTDSDFPVINYSEVGASINSLTVNADSDTSKLGISWTVPSDKDYSSAIVFVDGKPQGFLTSEKTNIVIDSTPGGHTVSVLPIDGNGKAGTKSTSVVTLGTALLDAVSDIVLTNTVEQQTDGTALIYIDATYTVPGLATSVVIEIGEGASPTSWTVVDDSTTGKAHILAKLAQLYTVRFTARNKYAVATAASDTITTAGDITPPGIPTITADAIFKAVTIVCTLSSPPDDMAGFKLYKSTTASSGDAVEITGGSISSKDGKAAFSYNESDYGDSFYYFAKAFDTWGNLGNFSGASSQVTILSVQGADLVDGALNRSELFVSGVVDATAIATNAVIEAKIATNAVTESKIVNNAIAEAKIANDAVTSGKIAAESVLASKLTVIARELINPCSVTKNVNGLCAIQEDGSGSSSQVTYSASENAIQIGSFSGAYYTIRPQTFLVDHNKIYRVTCQIKKSVANGSFYLGFAGFALSMPSIEGQNTILQGTESVEGYTANRVSTGITTNHYMLSAIPATTSYVDFTCFIIGANRSIDDCPNYAGANAPFCKMQSTTTHATVRILNYANTVDTALYVKNFSITESGAGQIVAENIVAGTITSNEIKALTITAGELATDCVTSDKILALNITAAKLAAGAVTSEKLLIGKAGSALNDDPNFADSSAWGTRGGTANAFGVINFGVVGNTCAVAASVVIQPITARQIPIDDSKQYRLRAWFYQSTTLSTTNYITYRYVYADGTLSGQSWSTALVKTTVDWQAISLTITPISSAVAIILGVDMNYYAAATNVYCQDLRIEEVLPATLIQDGAIITDKLAANAVTAVKIEAGAVTAVKIEAGAVTADKILVGGSGAALNSDTQCIDLSAWRATDSTTNPTADDLKSKLSIVDITDGYSGTKALRCQYGNVRIWTNLVPVDPSKQYRFSYMIRGVGLTGGTCYIAAGRMTAAGSFSQVYPIVDVEPGDAITPVPTTWTRITGYYTPIAGIAKACMEVIPAYLSTAGYTEIQDVRFEEVIPGTLIKDGAITTDKIYAGSVTADKVDATVVKTTELQVSGKNRASDASFDKVPYLARSSSGVTVSEALSNGYLFGWEIVASGWSSGTDVFAYTIHGLLNPGECYSNSNGIELLSIGTSTDYGRITGNKFAVKENTPYTISCYMKASSASGARLLANITYYTSSGVAIGSSVTLHDYEVITTTALTRYSAQDTSPSGAVFARLRYYNIYKSGSSETISFTFSACQVEEGSTVTTWIGEEKGSITADRIVTGQIKSINYSTTAGSLYDLDNGTIALGGSSSPTFSVTSDGAMTATSGYIGSMGINSDGIYDYAYISGVSRSETNLKLNYFKLDKFAGGITSTVVINVSNSGSLYDTAPLSVTLGNTSYYGIYTNASIYIGNVCSAYSFTDRTEMPETIEEAFEIVNTMKAKDGKVDYSKLSDKAKKRHKRINKETGEETIEEGRDLTKTVSALVMVVQKLQEEIADLKKLQDKKK